ncbi:type I restriction enzyme subunit R domain-containing protein, partial [Escherichia coli]|uniref:type I restriction enzyme subunit R domain-containing protein n=1 Tax=Escherichia coli TaxID=562 RepID=UPI002119B4A5
KPTKHTRKTHDEGELPVKQADFERWPHIDAEEQVQKDLIECFKDPEHPLQLIIVTAKLLTGYDAPICYCKYLDKHLRHNTLNQAKCRTKP